MSGVDEAVERFDRLRAEGTNFEVYDRRGQLVPKFRRGMWHGPDYYPGIHAKPYLQDRLPNELVDKVYSFYANDPNPLVKLATAPGQPLPPPPHQQVDQYVPPPTDSGRRRRVNAQGRRF